VSASAILPDRLAGHDLVIAGDVMLDHFVVGRVDRISPEAPVPVVRFEREEYRLGGAANVAHNVVALGSRARLVGVIGHDDAAGHLSRALHTVHLDDAYLVADKERPTTRKVRVVTSRNQQVARIDYETDADPAVATTVALVERMRKAVRGAQAIVVSDYRKGVVTPMLLAATFDAARQAGAPVLVDPKVMQADWYRGASLITPNHHEASFMSLDEVSSEVESLACLWFVV
jgi:D-beta-D-heptose 7-phosphate kinase/D-beta-D-heptose 1-phosphate adenosyltransferase